MLVENPPEKSMMKWGNPIFWFGNLHLLFMIDIVNGLEICANCCLDLYLNHFNHLNCCILWPINSSSVVIKSLIYQFLVASPEIQTCSFNVWSSPTNRLLRSGFRSCRFVGQDVAPWPLGISINLSCSEKR